MESESIMTNEIEVSVKTEDGVRVTVSEWDDGGAWMYLQGRGASMSTVLTVTRHSSCWLACKPS